MSAGSTLNNFTRTLQLCTCIVAALYAKGVYAECILPTKQVGTSMTVYQDRGNRCEGLLPIFVTGSENIQLVGYQYGTPPIPGSPSETFLLKVKGSVPAEERITLRVTGRTNQARYQMDTSSLENMSFEWDQKIIGEVGKNYHFSGFGLLACSNNCVSKAETIYWPIAASPRVSDEVSNLSIALQSEIRAGLVTVKLKRREISESIVIPTHNLTLLPGRLSKISLPPGLVPGLYQLDVDARSTETQRPLGMLMVNIFVPSSDPSINNRNRALQP